MKFSNLNVLAIDDHENALMTLGEMLTTLGVPRIWEAHDGLEAMGYLDAFADNINLIICDWNMPGMTGIELLRQVRSVNSRLPFLMATGRGDVSSVLEAKISQVSGYILKPFTLDEIQQKIEKTVYTTPYRSC